MLSVAWFLYILFMLYFLTILSMQLYIYIYLLSQKYKEIEMDVENYVMSYLWPLYLTRILYKKLKDFFNS